MKEDLVAVLTRPAEYSKDELAAFKSLSESPAFQYASLALTKMKISCGLMALEDGKTDYWRGISEGLDAFFFMVGVEADNYEQVIKDIEFKQSKIDKGEENEYDDGIDLTQAISHLGSSPL